MPGIEVSGSSQNPMPGGAAFNSGAAEGSPCNDFVVVKLLVFLEKSQERSRVTKGLRGGYTCCVFLDTTVTHTQKKN